MSLTQKQACQLMYAKDRCLTTFAATKSAAAMSREVVFKRTWKAHEAAQKKFERLIAGLVADEGE